MPNNTITSTKRGLNTSYIARKRTLTEAGFTSMHSSRSSPPLLMGEGSLFSPAKKLARSAGFSRESDAGRVNLQRPAPMIAYRNPPDIPDELLRVLKLLPNMPKADDVKKLSPQYLHTLMENAFNTMKGLLLIKDKLSHRQEIIQERSDLNQLLAICEREYDIATSSIQPVNLAQPVNNSIDIKTWLNSSEIACINRIFLRLGDQNEFVSQSDYGEKIKTAINEFSQDIRNGYRNHFQLLVENDSELLAHEMLRQSHFPADQAQRVNIITPEGIRDIVNGHKDKGFLSEEVAKHCLDAIDITKQVSSPWLRSDFFREILLMTMVKTNEVNQAILATALYTDLGLQTVPKSHEQSSHEQSSHEQSSHEQSIDKGKDKGKGKARQGASVRSQANKAYRVPLGARFYGESSLMSLSAGMQDENGQFINPFDHIARMLKRHVLVHRQFSTEDTRRALELEGEALIHTAIGYHNQDNIEALNQKMGEVIRFIAKHNLQLSDMDVDTLNEADIHKMSPEKKYDFLTNFDKIVHTAEVYPTFLEGQKYLSALPMIRSYMAELSNQQANQQASDNSLTEEQQFMLAHFTDFKNILLAKYGRATIDVTDNLVMDTMESFFQHSGVDVLVQHGIFSKAPCLANSGAWHFQPEEIPVSAEALAKEMAKPSWRKEVKESHFTPEAVVSYAKSRLNIDEKEIWYYNADECLINKVMMVFDGLIDSRQNQYTEQYTEQEKKQNEEAIGLEAEVSKPSLTWRDRLRPEFNGRLPEKTTFQFWGESVELTGATIQLILQTADEASLASTAKFRYSDKRKAEAEKALAQQGPDDWCAIPQPLKRRSLVPAIIRHFAPGITNRKLHRDHSAKKPLPDVDSFSGAWQRYLKKPLPESVDFRIQDQVVTLTKASMVFLLNHIADSQSRDQTITNVQRVIKASLDLNRYNFRSWNELKSSGRIAVARSFFREFASIPLSSDVRRPPLPPLETLTGTWKSKLSKPLEDKLSLMVGNEKVTLSRHTLSFICWFAEQRKVSSAGNNPRRQLYRDIVKTLNHYKALDWDKLKGNKGRDFQESVIFVFLGYATHGVLAKNFLPKPENLSDEWELYLKRPLPDLVTHNYRNTTVTLSKDTVSFMLSKVYETGNDGMCAKKKYAYVVKELNKYSFSDWHRIKNMSKRDLVGSLVKELVPNVRRKDRDVKRNDQIQMADLASD